MTTDTRPFDPEPGVIRDVPLELIFDSPAQELETYDAAYIAELGASIKALGHNHTAILLRPRPNGLPGYETTFGHCRKRACAWAELPTCRAEIRDMTDLEVEQAQLSENLNRRIASPLEEATRFDRLMRIHKLTVPQLMENFGKSKGYVYGRLSLLKLSDAVRQAMAQGLQTETALVIAKHDNDRIQQLAIAKVRRPNGDWMPTLEAKRVLNDAFIIRLSKAPFDLKDDKLFKRAGSCADCHNCAANNPGLADLPADACLDSDCYDLKLQEHWLHIVMQLQDDGHTVLQDEDEIRGFSVSGFVPLAMSYDIDGRTVKVSEIVKAQPEGTEPPKLTYIAPEDEEPRGYIAATDLHALMVALGLKKPEAATKPVAAPTPTAAWPRDDEAEEEDTLIRSALASQATRTGPAVDPCEGWTDAERATVIGDALRGARQAAIRNLLNTPRNTDELRLMARREVLMADGDLGMLSSILLGTDEFSEAEMLQWVDNASPDQLSGMLAALAVDYSLLHRAIMYAPQGQALAERRVKLLESYGVNILDYVEQPAAQAQAEQAQQALDGMADPDEEAEDEETAPAIVHKSPSKNVARYRNKATGETWSGRGLQPKWLKAAIAAGGKLDDYRAEEATA